MTGMRVVIATLATSMLAVCLAPGCNSTAYGTGTRGGEYSIPPRPAGATYPNWEHLCITPTTTEIFDNTLRQAGAQGWELIGFGDQVTCFKRPAPPSPDAGARPAVSPAPDQPEPEQAPAVPPQPD
jgi:hypothetical protein